MRKPSLAARTAKPEWKLTRDTTCELTHVCKRKGASFLPYSIEGGQPMECHTVYLLHFSQRYQHAGHYLGSSHNLTK